MSMPSSQNIIMPMYKGKTIQIPRFPYEDSIVREDTSGAVSKVNKFYIEEISRILTNIALDRGALALDKTVAFQNFLSNKVVTVYETKVTTQCKRKGIDCYHQAAKETLASCFPEFDAFVRENLLEHGKLTTLLLDFGYKSDQPEQFDLEIDQLYLSKENIEILLAWVNFVITNSDKLAQLKGVRDTLRNAEVINDLTTFKSMGGELRWWEKILLFLFDWYKPKWLVLYQERQNLAGTIKENVQRTQDIYRKGLLNLAAKNNPPYKKAYSGLLASFGFTQSHDKGKFGKLLKPENDTENMGIYFIGNNMDTLNNWSACITENTATQFMVHDKLGIISKKLKPFEDTLRNNRTVTAEEEKVLRENAKNIIALINELTEPPPAKFAKQAPPQPKPKKTLPPKSAGLKPPSPPKKVPAPGLTTPLIPKSEKQR